ncbi:MAG: phosphatase PAP2 family protein [Nitrospiraceae bacterium]
MTLGERLGFDCSSRPLAESIPTGAHRPQVFSVLRWVSLLCAIAAIAVAGIGLVRLDAPIARFVRSLQHPLGFLLDTRLAWWSQAGDWLGGGVQLVCFSLALVGLGYIFARESWRLAGLQSLWAHALAALLSHAVKRSIGRPRPKFSHTGEFELWPSFDNGFDSFPSGHASASFAVAAVLAARLPRWRWLWYGLATAIAMSRILRSAHFPSDVIGGAAIGMVAGAVVSGPIRRWGRTLCDTGVRLAPWIVAVYAVLATVSQTKARDGVMVALGVCGGVIALSATGWLLRTNHADRRAEVAQGIGWFGVAVATGLTAVIGPAALAVGSRLVHAPREAIARGSAETDPFATVVRSRVAVLVVALGLVWICFGLVPLT